MTPVEMETMLTEVAQHVRQLQTDVHSVGDRLGRVESRLGRVEDRLDGVEARLSGVETQVTSIDGHVKNLDLRTTNIEQILPTLATKADLASLEKRLEDRIEDSRREARVLFEDVRGDIRMLAEHVVSLGERRERDS